MRPTETGHVEELLDAYRTGELDPARHAAVGEHLEACERCREAWARLEPWSEVVARGFAARRAAARDLEPDWAAQRAAIVARTSGRTRSGEGRRALWRWAPQVALVALAALIVGIVWRENPRDPRPRIATESRPEDFAPGVSQRARESAVAEPREETAATDERDDGAQRDADVAARGAADDALPPPAPPAAKAAPEEAEALGRVGNERRDALADRAPEAAAAQAVAEGQWFEDRARAALAARDTLAARRALAFWVDSLRPAERDAARSALADSLAALLSGGS